jgi:hypothetical protein
MVSPGNWLVSSIWFLLSTGEVAIGGWGSSLLDHAGWSELLLFSPGGSCLALQLQLSLVLLCLQGEAIQFWILTSVPETSSRILHLPCFGRLTCHPTHGLRLCCFSYVHSLRVQLLVPPLFFRVGSVFHPHLHCCCWITIHCLCFSVLFGGDSIYPVAALDYVPGEDGWEGSHSWYMMLTLFVLQIHASSFIAGQWREMVYSFPQCGVV